MLLNNIYKLMDYDPLLINSQKVISDFNHKFTGSYCFINGTLYYLEIITDKEIICTEATFSYQDDHTIEPFFPKTGIYIYKDYASYLHRKPAKQWIKSFSNSSYHQKVLNLRSLKPQELIKAEYKEELAIHKNKVYFHWFHCGTLKDYTIYIYPEFNNFENEIKELCPQYKISLDLPTPKKSIKGMKTLDPFLDLKLN